MRRNFELYLEDILESITIIENRVKGQTVSSFVKNSEKHDSVIYRLALIGEAVNKLPKNLVAKHPQINWAAIIGMRNFLIHEYFSVDIKVIWHTIQTDLNELKAITLLIKKSQL